MMTACTFSARDNFECMKNFVDDLLVTCDEIADTPECANQSYLVFTIVGGHRS